MTISPQYLGIYVILPRIANGPMKMGLFTTKLHGISLGKPWYRAI